MRIVRRTLELSNQPPLLDEALSERAKVWAETLFLVVPEDRLIETLSRAVKDHTSTFPINAYDLKLAYDKIVAEDLEQTIKEREQRLRSLEERARMEHRPECIYCFNCGWETEIIDGYSWAKKCYVCDYWKRDSERRPANAGRK